MLSFLNLQPESFGLDIDDSFMRLVKLKKKKRGFLIASFNELLIPKETVKDGLIQDAKLLAETIKTACKTVKGQKLNTKYVTVSLPEEKAFSQVIQMPDMKKEELAQAIAIEAENYIPLPIEKVYLDFQIINPEKKSSPSDILINAMPKTVVDSYVSCLKRAGLMPFSLETRSQAFARALVKSSGKRNSKEQQPPREAAEINHPVILIDFGEDKSSFIIHDGNSLRFASSLPVYSNQLTKLLEKQLGFTLKQAERIKVRYGLSKEGEKKYNIAKTLAPVLNELAAQIKKYVDFYKSHLSHKNMRQEVKFEKIIIGGQGADLKGIDRFLSEKLNLKTEIGNPLANILNKKNSSGSIIPFYKVPSFTAAIGLAQKTFET